MFGIIHKLCHLLMEGCTFTKIKIWVDFLDTTGLTVGEGGSKKVRKLERGHLWITPCIKFFTLPTYSRKTIISLHFEDSLSKYKEWTNVKILCLQIWNNIPNRTHWFLLHEVIISYFIYKWNCWEYLAKTFSQLLFWQAYLSVCLCTGFSVRIAW